MSDIKLPMMLAQTYGTATDAKTDIASSALYKYLGWSSSRRKEAQKVIDATDWNLVAALVYACKEAEQWEEDQKKQQKKEE